MTDAVPVLDVSVLLVAVTIAVVVVEIVEGAVKRPVAEIVPAVVDHVTP